MDNIVDDGHVYERRLYNDDRMAVENKVKICPQLEHGEMKLLSIFIVKQYVK